MHRPLPNFVMNEWISLEELRQAYLECRKRKRNTEACAIFEINEAYNLYELYEDLNNFTYEIGYSNAFCVTRPKLREIFAAEFRDRIVHHLIIRKIEPLLEAEFIETSCSCRVGKGTHYTHQKLHELALEYADGWVLSGDIQSYFMSIPKEQLADEMETFVRTNYKGNDIEPLVWLIRMVIMHEPQNRCIYKGDLTLFERLPPDKSLRTCPKGRGQAIGNLTSQKNGNFHLTPFDKLMLRIIGPAYVRYTDDFSAFSHNKQTLLQALPVARQFLREDRHVNLHPRKIRLQPVRKGFKSIGAAFKRGQIRIGSRTAGNCHDMIRRYNELPNETLQRAMERFVQKYNSYMGYMVYYKSYTIRYRLWEYIKDPIKNFVYINEKKSILSVKPEYKTTNILKQEYYGIRKQHQRRRLHKEQETAERKILGTLL